MPDNLQAASAAALTVAAAAPAAAVVVAAAPAAVAPTEAAAQTFEDVNMTVTPVSASTNSSLHASATREERHMLAPRVAPFSLLLQLWSFL